MHFSTIQGIALALVGLTKAQSCGTSLVDFENLPNPPALGVGVGAAPVPPGYSGLIWPNFYGATPSLAAQFLLPQGKVFAVAPNSPATNPPVIVADTGRTFDPRSIFIGTFQTGVVSGAAALSTASTVTVTARFQNTTTAQTTFNFNPPNSVFGLALNAEAMQHYQFPCNWAKVVTLSFRPQAENGLNGLLGLAIDNFRYIDDTSA